MSHLVPPGGWSLPVAPGPTLSTPCTCGETICWAADLEGYGHCEGAIEVIDEDWDEEHGEHTWIHGCQRHPHRGVAPSKP